MSFTATVLRVLVASPSDVPEARDVVESAIHSWNSRHAATRSIVLLPWRWESSSVPLLGDHPQSIINEQGGDGADIVVALFGSRLGSPTREAVSGTVEEIERAVNSGKPVHLYFSTAPLPHDVDTPQLDGLRQFRQEISERGLLGEFDDARQLESQIWAAIELDLARMDMSTAASQETPVGVRFRVGSNSKRLQTGIDKSGKAKYETKRWYEVTNTGDLAAESVTFEGQATSGLMRLLVDNQPITLEPEVSWKVPVLYSMGTAGTKLTVHWVENGENQSKTFDVQ
ncbi:MAG: DUF4062 domain-containing protein [Corynebacterium amycolatum]|uniref:DUF4062 domain-containing protein n=1 Tax=Corynebacterium sp. LK22 TaxID=2044584 RepID=UPI002104409B|nr:MULTISPECIES: DUF4062 domain-containing protein [Corynebacterium]MDK8507656.1 DUF4062 domain-containing protein [Corynebacterium amycolatum]